MTDQQVQGVTVCHNTADLLLNAVCSLRKHHNIPIIIVNGSDTTAAGNDCTRTAYALSAHYKGIQVINVGYNLGHGDGLDLGIRNAQREHVLIFDTDILVKQQVLHLFPLQKYYAAGEVVFVNDIGINVQAGKGIRYVHPYFAMVNRLQYARGARFTTCGAPLLRAMKYVNQRNPAWLVNVELRAAVTHLERGTRKVIPPEAAYHSAPNREQHTI